MFSLASQEPQRYICLLALCAICSFLSKLVSSYAFFIMHFYIILFPLTLFSPLLIFPLSLVPQFTRVFFTLFFGCTGLSLVAVSGSYPFVVLHGLLIAVASLVVKHQACGLHQLQLAGLSVWAQYLGHTGFATSLCVESFWTRDQSHVPCIGRQIHIRQGGPSCVLLNHFNYMYAFKSHLRLFLECDGA